MSFSVKKEKGELIFNDFGSPPKTTRNPSTIWCIVEANKIYNWNDFNEITICTWDQEFNEEQYTYSKQNNKYINLVPDFHFHAWPETGMHDYDVYIEEIESVGLLPYEINKVGWIGSITHANREHLLDIGLENMDLFDFKKTGDWHYNKIHNLPFLSDKYKNHNFLSAKDLVKTYSILIDIEGEGYSGRVKHLLWSHRPLLLVDRPHKEYYYEYLKPWNHYIPVQRDLSDLIEKTKWCLENYDEALKIAENAYQFAKIYLTRAGCYQQWNKIISQHIRKNMSYKIVASRYNENIDWLIPEMDNCIIFNKGETLGHSNEFSLKNVGREADAYLNYIIRAYDSLPDVVLFTKGDRSDISSLHQMRDEAVKRGFTTPCVFDTSCLSQQLEHTYLNKEVRPFNSWFETLFGIPYPDPLMIYSNSFFAIQKKFILKKSREYYETLLEQVNYNSNPIEANFIERSWFYIFDLHRLQE